MSLIYQCLRSELSQSVPLKQQPCYQSPLALQKKTNVIVCYSLSLDILINEFNQGVIIGEQINSPAYSQKCPDLPGRPTRNPLPIPAPLPEEKQLKNGQLYSSIESDNA